MRASSLYLHVPFCISKCPYCAFSSAPKRRGDEARWLDAVSREFALRAPGAGALDTLYIGGGTPSALSFATWRRLIALIEGAFAFAPDAEVTVELNPGALSPNILRLWRDWRVTRTSVGAQSFDDDELVFLGRTHRAREAADAVCACRAAGFSTSLDLMLGLPGGTLRGWAANLSTALSLLPDHISIYQLSIEPQTPFGDADARTPFALPDGYAPYRYAQWLLPRRGYSQYEVASFARPGRESRHNLGYWADEAYLGIGPAAWGYLDGTRYRNAPTLEAYAAPLSAEKLPVVYEERLEGEAAARQAAVLALRTCAGISWEAFAEKHGQGLAALLRRELERFAPDFVRIDDLHARMTPRGLRLGNEIWSELI